MVFLCLPAVFWRDATGIKLKKKVTDGTTITTTEYMQGFQYTNNVLDFFPHAEGYVKALPASLGGGSSYQFKYVFTYTDHLGNIRLKYAQDPSNNNQISILEEDHYYPYGLKHSGYNSFHQIFAMADGGDGPGTGIVLTPVNPFLGDSHKYKFGGKEYQDEFDVNTYDFGARNYDPALARWMNLDPLAEMMRRHSPYNYAFNNPIYFIDPDGMAPENIIISGKNGNEITIPTAGADRTVSVPFDIEQSGTLDLGLSEVNSDNIAVGYEVSASTEAKATLGGKVSAGLTVVNYFNEEYGDYNYVYANAEVSGSTGVQAGVNADIGANFFVMGSSEIETAKPESFSGNASSMGYNFDAKSIAGGGVSISAFESGNWKGLSVGLNVGIGEGATLGAATRGESTSVMLSNEKPTSERSTFDRFLNKAGFTPMVGQALYQYIAKQK